MSPDGPKAPPQERLLHSSTRDVTRQVIEVQRRSLEVYEKVLSWAPAPPALKAHLVDFQMHGGLEVVDSLLERLDHGAISPVEAMEQLFAA